MALCSNCGKGNRDGSRFCQSCGTPLSAPEVAQPPAGKRRSSQELASAPVCSGCGALNAPGMKFCKMCGSPLEALQGQATKLSCPSCGGQTPSGYKFCQHCGTPLPTNNPAVVAPATPAPAVAATAAGPVSSPAAGPVSSPAAAPLAVAPAPAPAPTPASSLTTPAGISPMQVQAVVAAARPAPIVPSPLQAVLTPAADFVGVAVNTPADQAKTIIEMRSPVSLAEFEARAAAPVLVPPTPAAIVPTAVPAVVPAPVARPDAVPRVAVAGSIQTPAATPPGGVPAAADPRSGVSTVGPGAGKTAPPEAVERRPLALLVSVNRDGSDGETHPITEECFDLGRCEGQLLFGEDPYLSERHCRFSVRNGRWQVQDLQSCNGVFVRIAGATDLRHGDRVLMGKQLLTFEILGEHERALAPAVQHGVLVFGSPLRTPWGRLRQNTVAGIYRDVYYLYRSRVTIGREEGDWLFPDDEFMSRQHLTIALSGTKVVLQDLQSSNGTFVQMREPQELQPGALIRVGDQLLRFESM